MLGKLRKILLWWIPENVYRAIKHESHFMIVRSGLYRLLTGPKPRKPAGLKVQIAAGKKARTGWFNIDGSYSKGIDLVADLRRPIPLPDCCAILIFCEHFLEHLDYYEETPGFLKECRRILEPGGLARFVVPDGEWYLQRYVELGPADSRSLHAESSYDPRKSVYESGMEVINAAFRMVDHKFIFDKYTLSLCLRKAGFVGIQVCDYGKSQALECIDSPERRWNSLYVEARRQS